MFVDKYVCRQARLTKQLIYKGYEAMLETLFLKIIQKMDFVELLPYVQDNKPINDCPLDTLLHQLIYSYYMYKEFPFFHSYAERLRMYINACTPYFFPDFVREVLDEWNIVQ